MLCILRANIVLCSRLLLGFILTYIYALCLSAGITSSHYPLGNGYVPDLGTNCDLFMQPFGKIHSQSFSTWTSPHFLTPISFQYSINICVHNYLFTQHTN